MVRLERESDVARRSGHRHRHDGGWRGRDGGKYSPASDRETGSSATLTRTPAKSRPCSTRPRKSAVPSSSAFSSSSLSSCRSSRLQGFEGKMFSPLAFTISFALLGSLDSVAHTRADALHSLLETGAARTRSVSHPLVKAGCICVGLQAVRPTSLARGDRGALPRLPARSRSCHCIGTEFLPSLDEGSIAVQTFRIPSISLPQSLALQNEAEKILKQFPEVIDVVSKTGRADIASDPMGVELSDVIVTLKPREDGQQRNRKRSWWKKCATASANCPGVASSFSQPIALRVDELVSGVKSAIGIKIFGDDLDVLKQKGDEVARVLGTGRRRGGCQRREGERSRLSADRNQSRQDRALRNQRVRHSGRDRDRDWRERKRAKFMKV